MSCKYENRLNDFNFFCKVECRYCTFEQEEECKVRHPEYFGKEKTQNPFTITCKRCGGDDIKVIAYEHRDLGVECMDCGLHLHCGNYYTKDADYSDMYEF